MSRRRELTIALALDVVTVVVFVAIGRREHDEGSALSQIAEVAAPFLIGLLAGWLVARAWQRPLAMVTGLTIWPTTVVVGMILRHWVFDRGTAVSFMIVATVFLGLFLVGWRAIAGLFVRGQNSTAAAGTS
jgi:hypothetical protein